MKKTIFAFYAIVLIGGIVLPQVSFAETSAIGVSSPMPVQSTAETLEKIKMLRTQILLLQQQLGQIQPAVGVAGTASVPHEFCYNFDKPINRTSAQADVVALNTVLTKEGFNIADKTVYSASEVAAFQSNKSEILESAGITSGTGNVGPSTVTYLKKYSCDKPEPIATKPVITTANNQVQISAEINVQKPEQSQSNLNIDIYRPFDGDVLRVGEKWSVKWFARNFSPGDLLKITLINVRTYATYPIASVQATDKKYAFVIPPSVPPGIYKLFLITSSGRRVGPQIYVLNTPSRSKSADINKDGKVNVDDLLLVQNSWGACSTGVGTSCLADLTGSVGAPDGTVDSYDLDYVSDNWTEESTPTTGVTQGPVYNITEKPKPTPTPTPKPMPPSPGPDNWVIHSPMVPYDTDVNDDGLTNVNDLLLVVHAFGPCLNKNLPATCAADIDRNGITDRSDLKLVIANWSPNQPKVIADVNRDGRVNVDDLNAVIRAWGWYGSSAGSVSGSTQYKPEDIDSDWEVGGKDLDLVIKLWSY